MATLTITYNTTTGKCIYSGLTAVMPDGMRRVLTILGIDFKPGDSQGHIIDKTDFGVNKRAEIVRRFNNKFNNTTNLIYGATEAVALTLTSV